MLRTVSRLDSEAPSEAISRGVADGCTTEQRLTRSLLGYGIVAGPFYVVVSLAQAAARDGFELSRHQWSLLANGPWGWVQVTNLILSGAMIIAAAVGYRRILGTGAGGRWAPRLLAVYGACLVAAGVFRADPMERVPRRCSGRSPGHSHPGRDTAHGGRRGRLLGPDRADIRDGSPLPAAGPTWPGHVQHRHRRWLLGRLRWHRVRIDESSDDPRLHCCCAGGVGLGDQHVSRPVPPGTLTCTGCAR